MRISDVTFLIHNVKKYTFVNDGCLVRDRVCSIFPGIRYQTKLAIPIACFEKYGMFDTQKGIEPNVL